jgi:hypothetical protein
MFENRVLKRNFEIGVRKKQQDWENDEVLNSSPFATLCLGYQVRKVEMEGACKVGGENEKFIHNYSLDT